MPTKAPDQITSWSLWLMAIGSDEVPITAPTFEALSNCSCSIALATSFSTTTLLYSNPRSLAASDKPWSSPCRKSRSFSWT